MLHKRLFVSRDVTFHESIPFYHVSSIQGASHSEFQTESDPETCLSPNQELKSSSHEYLNPLACFPSVPDLSSSIPENNVTQDVSNDVLLDVGKESSSGGIKLKITRTYTRRKKIKKGTSSS